MSRLGPCFNGRSIPAVGNVVFVSLLFFLIFGIIMTNTYKGMFFYCEIPEEHQDYVAEEYGLEIGRYVKPFMKSDCLNLNGTWVNQNAHFDPRPWARWSR